MTYRYISNMKLDNKSSYGHPLISSSSLHPWSHRPRPWNNPCQETQKNAPETHPAYNRDLWSAAHPAITSKIWMLLWTAATTSNRPQPPTNHQILTLTAAFQDAIQENNIFEVTFHQLPLRPSHEIQSGFLTVWLLQSPCHPQTCHVDPQISHRCLHPTTCLLAQVPDSHPTYSTTFQPVTSSPNSSGTTGVASPMTSTPGCPLSWTNSPWPGVTTLSNCF